MDLSLAPSRYAKLQTEKLPGDLQDAQDLFVTGSQFCKELLLLQLKSDLVGDHDRAYSFRNARNREDAAQRLQSFVHGKYPLRKTFTVDLAY
jgi:hypothetical protein